MPDGGERVILATDRRLGTWSREVWKAALPEPPDYAFTVLELRLNRRGVGEGKMSLGGKIAVEAETKTLALENYKAAPILLKNVKHQGSTHAQPVARPTSAQKR
jgi:hypothetical protein